MVGLQVLDLAILVRIQVPELWAFWQICYTPGADEPGFGLHKGRSK